MIHLDQSLAMTHLDQCPGNSRRPTGHGEEDGDKQAASNGFFFVFCWAVEGKFDHREK
jgi:hypothetical protein